MDKNIHKEYIKLNKDSKTAVLFIHGILGTPRHFDKLVPLVPDEYNIYNILLDGHGGDVTGFSNTSMKKWKAQVENTVNEILKTNKELIIVAHSMGTLFAISEAIKHKSEIKRMFFLASPLKLFIKPRLFLNSARVYFGISDENDKVLSAAKAAYGIVNNDKRFWRYFGWIPRYFELFSEIRKTRRVLKSVDIDTPIIVFQSEKDEMVSKSSRKYLGLLKNAEVNLLKRSSHFYYDNLDFEYLLSRFEKFIAE